ncbi:MAG: flagellar hook-basal body complex protein [Lachnospiraceae bacterium]|nr:flagellar hook-basal body complex protein [Candidatus Colinaster equi]
MMRSMYSGVAGLKTHQTKMDVIGNNIANVNTVAYKSQSVTFSELMYQTTQSASGANAATGTAGVNAKQIGLGVKTGAINTAISSQGASQTTNNPFDIRITGDAFFIVSNGTDNFFTRDGSFYVDGLGNLAMTSNGYNVMGWQVDPETMDIKQDTVSALRIMSADNMTYPPEATTKATISGIIDKNDTNVTASAGKNMNLLIYDNLGYPYTVKFNIKNTTTEGAYVVSVADILDQNNESIGDISAMGFGSSQSVGRDTSLRLADGYAWDGNTLKFTDAAGTTDIYTYGSAVSDWDALAKAYNYGDDVETFKSFTFTVKDADGNVTENVSIDDVFAGTGIDVGGTTKSFVEWMDGDPAAPGPVMKAITAATITMDNVMRLNYDPLTGKFVGIGGQDTVTLGLSNLISPGTTGSKFEDVVVDFTNTTMFNNSGTSTIAASNGDVNKLGTGRKLGEMSGVSIQKDGRIYASYDNGMSKLLGQIAVAEFANASGLEKEGDNLYKSSQNSGEFDGIGVEVTAGGGYMTTGVLEMSNVDLSAEFTDMITTQRGFQANSRIITVSDTLLEELVNLKR